MNLGGKLCLFVCYVKHVDNKRWGDKGIISIHWRRGRMLLDEYKKWSLRAKKERSVFVIKIVAVCVDGGACRNR